MRAEVVLQEIIGEAAGKNTRWLYRTAPPQCRWGAKTHPPLFSEARTRAWWEKSQ